MYLPAGSFLPLTMKSNGMFASRFPIKPANPAIDRAAMTLSVMTTFRICFFIVYSIRFLWQPRFRFAACVYRMWTGYSVYLPLIAYAYGYGRLRSSGRDRNRHE